MHFLHCTEWSTYSNRISFTLSILRHGYRTMMAPAMGISGAMQKGIAPYLLLARPHRAQYVREKRDAYALGAYTFLLVSATSLLEIPSFNSLILRNMITG